MSHATKRIEKEFRKLGATRAERTKHEVIYMFPDGARELVPLNASDGFAGNAIRRMHERYGRPDRAPLARNTKVSGAPKVDLTKAVAAPHAKERLALMREQADVTFLEVTTALTCPARVLWSDRHGSWVWEGDRVAVVADVSDDGFTRIRTILWTTNELWAAHPRPEKETT